MEPQKPEDQQPQLNEAATPQEAPVTDQPVSDTSNQIPENTNDEEGDSSVTPVAPEEATTKGGGLKKFILALVALLLLAGLAYGVYALLRSDKSQSSSTSSVKKVDIPVFNVGVVNGGTALYEPNDTDSYHQGVVNQVYEGLVSYQDRSKIVPLLSTGWTNPNSSTWDFDLKQGVTFHNGHVMTATDVAYSINLAAKDGPDAAYSGTIKEAKALSDYKVEIVTTKPDPFLLNKLTFLMVTDSKQPNAKDGQDATGPYMVKPGTSVTENELNLVAYDKYHGGHVYTRALNYKVEKDENTAAADLKAGKVNMIGEFNADNPSQLNGFNYQKIKINDPAVNFMTLNSIAPGPLQKKEVREALRQSIDIPELLKNTSTAATPASQLVTQEIPGYNPSLTVPTRDITKAKSLLTQAGYTNGVNLTLYVSPSIKVVGDEIAKQAKDAGFNITVKVQPVFDQLIGDMIDGKTDATILSYSSDTFDGSDVFTQVIQQTANFKSATLDNYLSQASSTIDQAKRLDILQNTSKYIVDEVAAIPLFNRTRIWATDNKPYVLPFESIGAVPGVYFWQVYSTR